MSINGFNAMSPPNRKVVGVGDWDLEGASTVSSFVHVPKAQTYMPLSNSNAPAQLQELCMTTVDSGHWGTGKW